MEGVVAALLLSILFLLSTVVRAEPVTFDIAFGDFETFEGGDDVESISIHHIPQRARRNALRRSFDTFESPPLKCKCPQDLLRFQVALCQEFAYMLNSSNSEGTIDSLQMSYTCPDDCLFHNMTCRVRHTFHGDQFLQDIYDFRDSCEKIVRYSYWDVTKNASATSQPVVQNKGTFLLNQGREQEIGYGGTPDRRVTEFMRVKVKDGMMIRNSSNLTGFHTNIELRRQVGQGDKVLVFAGWMHVSPEWVLGKCERQKVLGAEYSVYSGTTCTADNLLETVEFYEADGVCARVTVRDGTGKVYPKYGTALCDGGVLYTTPPMDTRGECLAIANTTHRFLASEPATHQLHLKGACLPQTSTATAVRVSAMSCQPRQPSCVWRKGYLKGTSILLHNWLSMEECLAVAELTKEPDWCGVVWMEPGVSVPPYEPKGCYAIKSGCTGPEQVDGAWGCLIKSLPAKSSKSKLQLWILVYSAALLLLIVIVMWILYVRYKEHKERKERAEEDEQQRGQMAEPAIVVGVPIPMVPTSGSGPGPRQLRERERLHSHDATAGPTCSAAPFVPDLSITTNPLQTFDSGDHHGAQGSQQAAAGEEGPSSPHSPSSANDEARPLAPAPVVPPPTHNATGVSARPPAASRLTKTAVTRILPQAQGGSSDQAETHHTTEEEVSADPPAASGPAPDQDNTPASLSLGADLPPPPPPPPPMKSSAPKGKKKKPTPAMPE